MHKQCRVNSAWMLGKMNMLTMTYKRIPYTNPARHDRITPPFSFAQFYALSPFLPLVPCTPHFCITIPSAFHFPRPTHLRCPSAPSPSFPSYVLMILAILSRRIQWTSTAAADLGGASPPNVFLCAKPPKSPILLIPDRYCNMQFTDALEKGTVVCHVGG